MKIRPFAHAALPLLLAGAATAQVVTIPLDSRQAFLHVDSVDTAQPAPALPLANYGLAPGQTVRMAAVGDFDNGPGGDQFYAQLAVFSSSPVLLAPSERYRVPGALGVGRNAVTGPTQPSGEPTDIPEDFYVILGDTVVIPAGATHLFVAPAETYYIDNSDPDGDFAVEIRVLQVASAPPPAAAAALSATPNPFNPQTSLSFTLPAPATARLAIHDLRGRRLRVLLDGTLDAGDHAVTWDGRDDGGRALPTGSYVARLEIGGTTVTTGLSLVR
jgi:hypothetical protein